MKRALRLGVFGCVTLSLAVSGALVYICYLQSQVFAYPPRSTYTQTPADVGIAAWREVAFTTADGVRLEGWYIPPPESNGAAILYVHGFTGNRGEFLEIAALLNQHGYGGLLFDLRNHGTSADSVTTFGLHEVRDVQAAYDYLTAQPDLDPQRIGIFGVSMGGATAIRATARMPQVKVLIVEAAFASFPQVVGDGVKRVIRITGSPFSDLIVWMTAQELGVDVSQLRPIDDIASISPRPILIIHGTADVVVPVSHGYRLYEAAGDPKQLLIVEGRHHADWANPPVGDYAATILAFLAHYL
ncbi:MAG: alpha/beta fold hydrolase [Anaerolineales bacterium]|nr:alpha/beta fold hydrolase [Anaerolineales bacterium]